jgi:hypothetical protein
MEKVEFLILAKRINRSFGLPSYLGSSIECASNPFNVSLSIQNEDAHYLMVQSNAASDLSNLINFV